MLFTRSFTPCLVGVVFLLTSIFCVIDHVDSSNEPRRWVKKCGEDSKSFLRWFCNDRSFDFPFQFRNYHIIRRYPAPRKELYPFQHQASICCKRGCQETGYVKMCWYHHILKHCERHNNHHTDEGRKIRADCLLELDKITRSYEIEQIPHLKKAKIERDLKFDRS